jgi:hypothetical protein
MAGDVASTGSAMAVLAQMTVVATKTVASNRRRDLRVLFTEAPFFVVMILGEPSNDPISEMIDVCDSARAQRTNVGVKAALKSQPKHQWWRRDTLKCVGNALETRLASTARSTLAK